MAGKPGSASRREGGVAAVPASFRPVARMTLVAAGSADLPAPPGAAEERAEQIAVLSSARVRTFQIESI